MGLKFQAIVLSSALLLTILATGVLERHCAIPGVLSDVIGDVCGLLSLTTPTVIATDGETSTLPLNSNLTAPTSLLSTGTIAPLSKRNETLHTFTAWPSPFATIVPVTTYVPVPQPNIIPCTAWFLFICASWDSTRTDIGGWQLTLEPGVYPPGPPPGVHLPPDFLISGSLVPWPSLTIGNDAIPTFAPRPTSCIETQSATMWISTTSHGVSPSGTASSTGSITTTSFVATTTSVIYGCYVETDPNDTPTDLPTSSSTESTVSSTSTPESTLSSTSTLESTLSSTSTPESTLSSTSTPESTPSSISTPTTVPGPKATWHLTMYDTPCGEDTKNYYSLRGFNLLSQGATCIALKEGHLPLDSATDNSCEFFTDGGNSPGKSCFEGTFWKPESFIIRDGFCQIWDEYACLTGGTGNVSPTLYKGCVNFKDGKNLPVRWESMKCYADAELF
ncbi:hypothetical protein GGR54DRAFT_594624 [Hypoxylon sp. NC1633]|nr:hypothetical protein GGR54DRAFT_594624 [Hypoxylon sp. NC1633]